MAFDASMSMYQVSQETGIKEHVVRHALKKMIESGAIKLRPFVSSYSLGLMEFHATITLETPGLAALAEFTKALVEAPTSTFVAEVAGNFHLAAMFLTRSPAGVAAFVDRLCEKAPRVRFRVAISPVLGVLISYPKRHASSPGNNIRSYHAGEVAQKYDELDEKILILLGSGHFSSRRELSVQCGVPQSTIDYRIQTLQGRGILLGMGYIIPNFQDGLSSYALQITASKPCTELRRLIIELARKHQAVRSVLLLTGNPDYIINVRLSHPGLVSSFARELHLHLGSYVSTIEVTPEVTIHKHYVSANDLHLKSYLQSQEIITFS